MNSLSVFGTSSDAGKSTISFALTYLLHKRGVKVSPFKAQNVSNNSRVCDDGGEIAVSQYFAAEAIGIATSHFMNPILLKSGSKNSAHLIINGKAVSDIGVREYYKDIHSLKPYAKKAFKKLRKEYECIVAEGAGSPVELNLMDKDLSNIFIAKEFDTKIILVADIERGGVFASIVGVYSLLPKFLRENILGVIINKFRGDITLFDDGIHILEERFGIKVLGVIPYKPFNLGFEDSQSILGYDQNTSKAIIKAGVIKLPHISNFTDFEPLVADEQIELSFISTPASANSYDMIIVPGSKRVVEDLQWLEEKGFFEILRSKKTTIVAICGGYEMMFERILDPNAVESEILETKGLGRFKGDVVFKEKKIVKKELYNIFDCEIEGYEIRNATAKKLFQKQKNLYGTFVHGLFDSDALREKLFTQINKNYKGYNFKEYKRSAIESFAGHIEEHTDIDYIYRMLNKP
ncbi:cobyric acid synthase [Sulfurimonas sp. HSL-1716]|uniref:cobyric acid synthase n=1 Tax=Hydrocurvibacter sulfurireducens TaxID=3131937 RepID=UPI0031F983FD